MVSKRQKVRSCQSRVTPCRHANDDRCASHAKIYLIGSKSDQADFIRVKPADAKKMVLLFVVRVVGV